MALKQSLSLKQTQNLMMTPQLQQAIKLLTLTHQEMTDLIATEMVENPMLEESGNEYNENDAKKEEDYRVEKLEGQNQEITSEHFEAPALMAKDDFDWATYVESYNSNVYQPPSMAKADFDEIPNYENMISRGVTLADHLEWQLRMERLSEDEWKVADYIINNINDQGYLEESLDVIVEKTGHDRDDTLEILRMIQKLDPVGCGSRDLQECLMAQARVLEIRSALVEIIIQDHMNELQQNDFHKIAQKTGIDVEQIKLAVNVIHDFHPRPGRLVSSEETYYIVPDIYVVQMGDEFVVRVNDDGVPRLKVSKLYQQMLGSKANKEAQDYVKEKLRAASFLIKSIHNRQNTIFKVAKAIVEKQQDFFKKGPRYLRPMVLRDIAQEIGMHESTVSRVTTNKYMDTPIGLFELRYFFNTGLGSKSGGDDISSEVVKIKIKEMLKQENPKRPLSDQKIVELLGRDNIEVARRTVAKYREELGILSSSSRKKKS